MKRKKNIGDFQEDLLSLASTAQKAMEENKLAFTQLKHVRRTLSTGGIVLVLDRGAIIDAEAEAMLQALHSRSIGGVDAHLVKLAQKGASQFMDTYYIGYGDGSIGDCGSATVFIEGVSMLVAKAVQDFMQYNGQESSTRYIDFSNQPFMNPLGLEKAAALLESLRAFHLEGLEVMKKHLAVCYPMQESEEEKVWQKAIKARAFDVMRSFLPAGATTNLAWHDELRQMRDHLLRLRNHPLEEVREVAENLHSALDEKFSSSFKQKRYETTEAYTRDWMSDMYYFYAGDEDHLYSDLVAGEVLLDRDGVDRNLLREYREVLSSRPIKTEPPKFLAECGSMRFSFLLDFGSFRDLQRHRSLVQRMPLLTTHYGFEPWYLEQMPEELRDKAKAFLKNYEQEVQAFDCSPDLTQYYLPMGYRVSCRITGDIPALMWVTELRSGIDVHPTLRRIAQTIGSTMLDKLERFGLKLYINTTPDRFNYRRGTQDIVEKNSSA